MTTKHTQGPWTVKKPNCGFGIFDASGKSVAAILSTQNRPTEEKKANANLIASAPELLESLETMLWILDLDGLPKGSGIQKAVSIAQNVVKKAKSGNSIEAIKEVDTIDALKLQISSGNLYPKHKLETPLNDGINANDRIIALDKAKGES
jgi:hypothetical protein